MPTDEKILPGDAGQTELNNDASVGAERAAQIASMIREAVAAETVPEPAEVPVPAEKKPEPAKKDEKASGAQKQKKKKTPKQNRKPAEETPLPGVYKTEIPKGGKELSTSDSLSFLLRDLKARQDAALPSSKADPRAAEKKQSVLCSLERVLTPIRILIFVLMALTIGGRTYSWMHLGLLGGESGLSLLMLLTVAAMAVSWQSVLRGLKDVVYFRFSYETVLLIATVISLLEVASTGNQESYLPFLTMSWCVCGLSAGLSAKGDLKSLRAMITARKPKGVYSARKRYEKSDIIGKGPANDSAFVRHLAEPDVWHWGWSCFGVVFVFLTVVAAVYLSAKTQLNILTVLANLFGISMPVGLVLCCGRPYYMLTRCLSGQAIMDGWFGAKALYGKKYALVYDSDLFPKDSITVKGYQLYDRYDEKMVTACAASLLYYADNGLAEAFLPYIRKTQTGILPITNFQSMEGGCQGVFRRNFILVGTYEFMQLMGMMPPANAPRNGIFVSIDGRLAGVFGIRYHIPKGGPAGFKRLTRELMLTPLLVTRHFSVTPAFVARWFRSDVGQMECPKYEARRALSDPAMVYSGKRCGFVLKDGVAAYSWLVSGGRRIYRMGKYLTVLSVVLALVLLVVTASAISAGTALVDPLRLLVMHLLLLVLVEILSRIAIRR